MATISKQPDGGEASTLRHQNRDGDLSRAVRIGFDYVAATFRWAAFAWTREMI